MENLRATELRIGDLLYKDGIIVTIDARIIFDIWDDKGLKKYGPIALTEEWLLRFGFEGSAIFDNSYILGSVEIYLQDGDYWFDFGNNDRVNVQYVHTLQNLFYILKGEELTIKEK